MNKAIEIGPHGKRFRAPASLVSRIDAYARHLGERLGTKPLSRSFTTAHLLLGEGLTPKGMTGEQIRAAIDAALTLKNIKKR